MKILLTYINPYLDDIAAFWLIRKFFPEYNRLPLAIRLTILTSGLKYRLAAHTLDAYLKKRKST